MSAEKKINSRFQYLHISNDVLFGNMVAVFLGDWLPRILFAHRAGHASEALLNMVYYLDLFYGAICVVVMSVVTVWYERPIRHCLKSGSRASKIPSGFFP